MAVRSKADAGQFREKARSMYFSNETVDWFLENSSAAQMRCVANLLDRELSARERNKRERMFRRATFASQPQVPCPCLYSIEAEHNSHGKLSTARIEN